MKSEDSILWLKECYSVLTRDVSRDYDSIGIVGTYDDFEVAEDAANKQYKYMYKVFTGIYGENGFTADSVNRTLCSNDEIARYEIEIKPNRFFVSD